MNRDPYVVPFYSSKPPRLRNYHSPAVFVATCAGVLGLLVHWNPLWAGVYFLGALALGGRRYGVNSCRCAAAAVAKCPEAMTGSADALEASSGLS